MRGFHGTKPECHMSADRINLHEPTCAGGFRWLFDISSHAPCYAHDRTSLISTGRRHLAIWVKFNTNPKTDDQTTRHSNRGRHANKDQNQIITGQTIPGCDPLPGELLLRSIIACTHSSLRNYGITDLRPPPPSPGQFRSRGPGNQIVAGGRAARTGQKRK